MAAAARWGMLALGAALLARPSGGCDFENTIDPYTEYYNLNGDWNAFTADDCKANCCADATCTVWQFAQYPMGHQAQCMTGDSTDYGDSGGIQFQGEQGRGGDPGGDPGGDGGGGGGGHKGHHKCIGVHCDDGANATVFLSLFGAFAGLYLVGGAYYGVAVQNKSGLAAIRAPPHPRPFTSAPPLALSPRRGGAAANAEFWRTLGGLVKDGVRFTASGGSAKGQAPAYQPVPDASAVEAGPPAVVVHPAAQPESPAPVAAAQTPKKKRRVKKSEAKKVRVKKVKAKAAAGSSLE